MAKVEMDNIDSKILRMLMHNARIPYLEIARECGISGAAIHQRVKKLTDMGVIQGARMIVDPKSLGFDVCAIIGIQLREVALHGSTVETLRNVPEVVECYFLTGKYNLLIKVYCRDNEHLMHTIFDKILTVQGITTTETFISLDETFARQVNIDDQQE
ncbi:MAG: Lrp/AsnC ligand binding domain-containing protein [Rikenellaceae bacterium]|jgi:Lrp/AsnC family transcriptional regulator for asnA, asnC and gidA|nr:Lrp/AsnC ligand binding domain-containing protein [Rikenellaceae bacterium]